MKRIATLCALIAAVAVAGCASVEEKPRQVKVGPISYVLDPAYTRLETRQARALVPAASAVYTIDGFSLDLVTIHASVREGRALGLRKFEASMSPRDIADAFGAMLTKEGFSGSYKIGKIENAAFAGAAGFRYEFSLRRRGLEMTGLGYGAVIDKKLYHLAYMAPKSYSFAKNLPLAEAMARSVQIGKSAKEPSAPETEEAAD